MLERYTRDTSEGHYALFSSHRVSLTRTTTSRAFSSSYVSTVPYYCGVFLSNAVFEVLALRSSVVGLELFQSFSCTENLPFTRENRKFQLEDQMVRAIPFGKFQKIWALICGDAIFLLF